MTPNGQLTAEDFIKMLGNQEARHYIEMCRAEAIISQLRDERPGKPVGKKGANGKPVEAANGP